MKFMVQILSLVEIVMCQAQKCRGAVLVHLATKLYNSVSIKFQKFQGVKKFIRPTNEEKSIILKDKELEPWAMQKIGGCCENILGRYDYIGILCSLNNFCWPVLGVFHWPRWEFALSQDDCSHCFSR